MHRVFALKLPKRLAEKINNDLDKSKNNIKIVKRNNEITFLHNEKAYRAVFYNLPCILEAQQTKDRKVFVKGGDVSNCLYVFDEEKGFVDTKEQIYDKSNNIGVNQIGQQNTTHHSMIKTPKETALKQLKRDKTSAYETHIYTPTLIDTLNNSGLSPGLFLAKLKFFRKKTKKAMETERIEQKVRNLIEKDIKADKVELELPKENSEEDKAFAAEIDAIMMNRPSINTKKLTELAEKRKLLETLDEKIKTKKKQIAETCNTIVIRRFTEILEKATVEREQVYAEIKELEKYECF